jgi:hypothetical protein
LLEGRRCTDDWNAQSGDVLSRCVDPRRDLSLGPQQLESVGRMRDVVLVNALRKADSVDSFGREHAGLRPQRRDAVGGSGEEALPQECAQGGLPQGRVA